MTVLEFELFNLTTQYYSPVELVTASETKQGQYGASYDREEGTFGIIDHEAQKMETIKIADVISIRDLTPPRK